MADWPHGLRCRGWSTDSNDASRSGPREIGNGTWLPPEMEDLLSDPLPIDAGSGGGSVSCFLRTFTTLRAFTPSRDQLMHTDGLSSPASESAVTAGRETLGAALGRIPSGLFVVTWRDAGADRAMLASWAMQAGFEPPLVSVAIGVTRDLLGSVRAGIPFVVNVLADSQRGLLGRFGKPPAPGEDPFAGLPVKRTPSGVIALAEAAAWLECEPVAEALAAGSDHTVFLGRVTATGGNTDQSSLVHLRRNGLKY